MEVLSDAQKIKPVSAKTFVKLYERLPKRTVKQRT